MRIPRTIKIGGQTIKVKITADVPGDGNGLWDSRKGTIFLHKDLPATEMEVTFIHEILHAINSSMEHKEVEYLAQAIYQVLIDNSMVFDGKAAA